MKRAKTVWSNSCFYVLREWGRKGWVYTIYDYWWESFWMGFRSMAKAIRWCEEHKEVAA